MICGQNDEVIVSPCRRGDHGEPLACETNGKAVLVGLSLDGSPFCEVNYPSPFLNISVVLPWIKSGMNQNSARSSQDIPTENEKPCQTLPTTTPTTTTTTITTTTTTPTTTPTTMTATTTTSTSNLDECDEMVYNPEWYQDGFCDSTMNNPECNYDGGDCCIQRKADWKRYCNYVS